MPYMLKTKAEPFDNTFEVGVINSNEIDPKQYASCEVGDNPENRGANLEFG